MKIATILFFPLVTACVSSADNSTENVPTERLMNLLKTEEPTCPKNHTDNIIPIMYGFPSEEMFAKSDSGLIMLGGCELEEEQNWCKTHQISF